MSDDDDNHAIEPTHWTSSLLEDLCDALKRQRDNDTVRAFARELMDDKDLPISYLVRKVQQKVGAQEAERLDVLIRGPLAVAQSKAEREESKKGVRGLIRRFLG